MRSHDSLAYSTSGSARSAWSNLTKLTAAIGKGVKTYGQSYSRTPTVRLQLLQPSISWSGLLYSRPVKPSVKLLDSVYVCEVGRTFVHDLQEGERNQRAWLLQERVLSHRTIHFTAARTYWECGSVIRYENLSQQVKPADFQSSS